jgi:UDP-GlcNAc:undecaprenyl-phosphate GlcNAc-1-phosphate transferase
MILGDSGAGGLLCICLAASLMGFLVFNAPCPKAKIFMGDGGALFLGYVLALLPLIVHRDGSQPIPLFYAVALALIPVYDTIAAIWRRIRDHRPIDSPDRAHIHYKLMNLGLSARGVDGALYSLQVVMGLLVIFAVKERADSVLSLSLLATAYIVPLIFFSVVHFMNRAVTMARLAGEKADAPLH